MIKGIIFDAGGILVSDNIREYAYKTASEYYNVDIKRIKELALKHEPYHDTPQFNEEEYWNRIARDLGINKNPRPIWTEKYIETTPLDKDVFDFIKKLKTKGYILAILSNTIPQHLSINKERGLYDLFEITVFSCDPRINSKKPELKIYQKCLEKIGLPPYQCIFIDDKVENLFPAKSLGIHTIHYQGVSQLKRDLKNFRVYV